MGRPPLRPPPAGSGHAPVPPAPEVLRALGQVLGPLVRLLLASGIDYSRLSVELKPVFIEQARAELRRHGQRETDSAVSVLSGVHRKDVRSWREGAMGQRIAAEVSPIAQLFARWLGSAALCDSEGRPRALPRLGAQDSFEALARSVTQDVHPFTLLGELLRLGLVRVVQRDAQDWVEPNAEGFVPAPGSRELLELFGANVADHASTAVANLLGQTPQLEQSVFASGLSPESAAQLAQLARSLWAQARRQMIAEASRLYEADRGRADARQRMRFGAYYWSEGDEQAAPGDAQAAPGDAQQEPAPDGAGAPT